MPAAAIALELQVEVGGGGGLIAQRLNRHHRIAQRIIRREGVLVEALDSQSLPLWVPAAFIRQDFSQGLWAPQDLGIRADLPTMQQLLSVTLLVLHIRCDAGGVHLTLRVSTTMSLQHVPAGVYIMGMRRSLFKKGCST